MSSRLIESLQHAAGKNQELLAILSQTDNAPSALKQNSTYITDLQNQIAATDKEIKRLHRITEDERKDHIKYEESTFTRYMYKMRGKKGQAKFAEKAGKEEKEFVEAWQKERETQESHAELTRALADAQQEQQRLQGATARHDQAQSELDRLYSSIFDGPTPEVPGEDQLESSLQNNKQWADNCTQHQNLQRRAAEALHATVQHLERAAKDMDDALDMSRWDMWGGGTFVDMMERDALSRAQVGVSDDVLFDNIFTDMAQHDRIKNSAMQLHKALQQCKEILEKQKRTYHEAAAQSTQATEALNSSRFELQRIRAEAFERFAGQGAPPPFHQATAQYVPPPAY
ncbi:uncharacterized protein M437DRAFT_47063 [Aureobasidium melanogenum CBS 110374]|uniref:Uncharacterized protein n=1 Tax=Aureobasidium melanogenum (strain CBS 110374) TaxID=1043003 RepID=A0A074VT88_AURM1|nr:uncharacterized protein M437DRAFT_47063 [Aureobasidium melanogenum CBS 110374]KEQ63618.1 hypothetical protein M437DRAFT_47063 [Aureobasidium melanogenum CBS 110374]